MNPDLQSILDTIQNTPHLNEQEKATLVQSIKNAAKSQSMTQFKLERLERDKQTLSVMLEENIEDLQKKSIAIEKQNRELEIEKALEKVRSAALSMKKLGDMVEVCHIISDQLESLHVNEIRNVQTAIINETKGTYFNYEYYTKHNKEFITEVNYRNHGVQTRFAQQMLTGAEELFTLFIKEKELKDWYAYQKTTNQFADTYLETSDILCYYWYSLGSVALGISTYVPLNEEEINLFKRFRNVFELAYRRYMDIEKVEAQAREVKIELALERVRARTMAMQNSEELSDTAYVLFQQFKELGENPHQITIGIINEDEGFVEFNITGGDGSGAQINRSYKFNIEEPALIQKMVKAWKENKRSTVIELAGKDLTDWVAHRNLVSGIIDNTDYSNARRFVAAGFFTKGLISISTIDLIETDTCLLLERFAKVFEQTYTRFLDLQKAEEQAREARIEAALERIRARALAMHSSEELMDVAKVLREQMAGLGQPELETSAVHMYQEDPHNILSWRAFRLGSDTKSDITYGYMAIPKNSCEIAEEMVNKFYGNSAEYTIEVSGSKQKQWYKVLLKIAPEVIKAMKKTNSLEEIRYYHFSKFSGGALLMVSSHQPSEETIYLQKRSAKVFDLAYHRFLDLQKTEAQAREAQIEAALERVRSRSMGMQKSEELKEVIQVVYEQFVHLKIHIEHTGFIMDYKAKDDMHIWLADKHEVPAQVIIPYFDSAHWNSFNEAKKKGTSFFANQLSFEEKNKFYQDLFKLIPGLPDETLEYYFSCPGLAISTVLLDNIGLYIENFKGVPYSEEENNILMRFGKVFQQTYTRFLDLQNAEVQAREAQIQLALERVRARTMAMQKSEELQDATLVLFQQFKELRESTTQVSICIFDDEIKMGEIYLTLKGERIDRSYSMELDKEIFVMKNAKKAFLNNERGFLQILTGKKLQLYNQWRNSLVGENRWDESVEALEQSWYVNGAFFSKGMITLSSGEQINTETPKLLERFAKVFDGTYTRFLDLQKAEAQARESQIEAGLERVRSRTLAMQKSDELAETAAVVFKQLVGLGIEPNRLYIMLIKDDSGDVEAWITDEDGTRVASRFTANKNKNVSLNKMYEGWAQQKKSITIDMKGKELEDYLHYLSDILHVPFKAGLSQNRRLQTIAYFSQGLIGIASPDEQPEATTKLLERFAAVFNLTYTRFNDLQVAEAQTRQAKIETALEKVRARALAMQQPEELKEVAEVLRYEMGLLGVEELETCSIYIHDKDNAHAECWYALKDVRAKKKKLVNDHFALDLNDTWVGGEMLKFYRSSKKQTSIVMQGANRKEWINYCEEHSAPLRSYYGNTIPDRTYHLYKFSHGAIGAATPADISEESWGLLKRVAAVFSLAYSRFKDLSQARTDLQQLKEEKKRAEEALTELQVTQKQLIQSEKMASLGELTAGIAHEIQNPLNFVNNFSEVSKELLDEMKTALDKGDSVDAKEIANDVIQNLEKINHHGKRADAIVKGMLQHSRSSGGQKELTDINALADEYLRLSYHGLRAKDKSFNASMKTDFDGSLEKISIIPQDIGRVILNLLTNAFYVVNEKRKLNIPGYEPIVTVSTKKVNDKIELSVTDNGNGIPQKALDKIFQPFFTTKPTGQGTGLGLSLSYDIITQGHGGELKVETKEGQGTTFIIQLPII